LPALRLFIELERRGVRIQFATAAVLVIAPLLILPGLLFYYDVTPKVAVVLFGTTIGLLLFLRESTLSEARRLWTDPLGRWFCVLTAAQIASLLLSSLFSSHPALAWYGGNWRRLGFVAQSAVLALAFLIAASFRESALRIMLRAISVAGIATALYGIVQYFGIDPFLPSGSYHIGEGVMTIVRPPSSLGHADYFAAHLLYVVFLGAALAVTELDAFWKVIGIAAVLAGSAAIALSGTRGALLGLATGACSLWFLKRPRLTRRHTLIAVSLCVISLAFYFSPAGLKLRARAQWELEDLRGGARLWLWRDSLQMARQHLLLGFGPETFGLEFPHYQSVELARAFPDFYHESPHNIVLDASVSQGIPGLAILVGFIAMACLAARRAIDREARAAPYLAAALVAALTAGLFVSFTLTSALFFYCTIAMLAGLAVPRTSGPTVAQPLVWLHVPAFAVSLTAVAMFSYFAIRLTTADFALEQAKRALDAGRVEDALASYALSQRWHPPGSSDDLYFSRALVAATHRASAPAFRFAQRASITSEERQNAWYNLAEFYATRNDVSGVEACLRRSIQASPNWFKPHWALSQALLLSGRRDEALAEAMRAAELDGGKAPEIAKFLQTVHHPAALTNAE